MPHRERVVLGGNASPNDWNLEPDPAQTGEILRRCIAVEPRLSGARVLRVEVGLRPARPSIRVEQQLIGKSRVIHNYGHGGVGVSMSWGCAATVRSLILGADLDVTITH